jgi:hypothetical protein
VLHGYGSLVAAWGADVPVSLNTRAEKIDWSGLGVQVETPKGTVKGRVVLITVSTGILASGAVLFAPDLPDWKAEAIYSLPMGTENKMGVHFDTDVFGEDGRGHYSTWNQDRTMAKVDASVMGLNTAHVFVGGRYGIWLEKQGQQACHDSRQPLYRHRLEHRAMDLGIVGVRAAGTSAPARQSGAPSRRSSVLCWRSHCLWRAGYLPRGIPVRHPRRAGDCRNLGGWTLTIMYPIT